MPAAAHDARRRLRAEERGAEIQGEERVPLRVGRPPERHSREDGCVVDQDVEAAERPRGGGHDAGGPARSAQVGAKRRGAHAARRDLTRGASRRRCRTVIVNRDVHARVGERDRDGAADADRAAGDERAPRFLDASWRVC